MTHPLTDKIIQAITHNIHVYDDTRPLRVDMRAAADWQLEQVIDWIEEYLTAGDVISESLKEAMRPQQQEDKQP